MTIIEIGQPREPISQRQRYSHIFAMIFGIISLFVGLNLRNTALNATTIYIDTKAGIRAAYPRTWLIDTDGDYIFRVRDMRQAGYKTTFQISTMPTGADTETRNILEALSFNRLETLSEYTIFTIEPFSLRDQNDATSMSYAFAANETDPFLASLPSVVRGLDILIIRRGQAIVLTFLADADVYDEALPLFRQFLGRLDF